MFVNRTSLCILWLALMLLHASFCLANDRERARAEFQRGVTLYSEENYPSALEAFRTSYGIQPLPHVLFNIANCERALYRYTISISSFEKLLDRWVDGIDEEMRGDAQRNIDEMTRMLGRIVLKEATEDATVLIDGQEAGMTPLATPLLVDPGRHSVQLLRNGYKPQVTTVNVASEAVVVVYASLQPIISALKVACHDESAVVRLDENIIGGCPYEGEVEPGRHLLRIDAPGKLTYTEEIEVKIGADTVLSMQLVPENVDERERRSQALLGSGIASLTLGASAVVVGIVFNVKGSQDEQEGMDLKEKYESSKDEEDANTYNDLKDDKIPFDNGMMIAGYVAGGALLITGAVLLWLSKSGEKESLAVGLMPTPGGVELNIRF